MPGIKEFTGVHVMAQQRTTRQFKAIKDAIDTAGRPLSIDEIHELASKDVPSIGQRTVYRVVRQLQEEGELTSVPVSGGADRYELTCVALEHHHHFHCTSCDRIFDIEGCPGELKGMVPKGFKLEAHELTLSGLCDRCA